MIRPATRTSDMRFDRHELAGGLGNTGLLTGGWREPETSPMRKETEMDANQWIGEFAGAIAAKPPSEEEAGEILELAATAAHASERIAAPLACYLAGRDGRALAELRAIADGIAPGS